MYDQKLETTRLLVKLNILSLKSHKHTLIPNEQLKELQLSINYLQWLPLLLPTKPASGVTAPLVRDVRRRCYQEELSTGAFPFFKTMETSGGSTSLAPKSAISQP